MSDLYSRQISFNYEKDGLLRRFPVPRVDIDEAEITLHFVIGKVELDPNRHSSRNAAIGSLFDQYSVRMVRESLTRVRRYVRDAAASASDDKARVALADFENRILSDDNRELLSGRLLQYFNESVETILKDDGSLDQELVTKDLGDFVNKYVLGQTEQEAFRNSLKDRWDGLIKEVEGSYRPQVEELAGALFNVRNKYPDFKILIEPDPTGLAAQGAAVSSIKIKSSMRNYKWSKVDVDDADLRHVRTLGPE